MCGEKDEDFLGQRVVSLGIEMIDGILEMKEKGQWASVNRSGEGMARIGEILLSFRSSGEERGN